ncbi:MAG: dihydroneopterin aldolase [Rhodothermia bacterium]
MNNSSMLHSGTVRLVNAVFYAHHGVTQEEHRLGGRYEVDVAMHLDFEEAAETDQLASTVDYEGVYGMVHGLVTGNKFYLIEKLAVLIGRAVLDGYPLVEGVEVTVRKHNPPVGGTCDRAEATYCLSRT